MAGLSSLGVGSGLDIRSIVDQLTALERRPLAQIQNRVTVAETRISALGQLNSAVTQFQDAVRALQRPSTFTSTQTTSSNSSLVSARSAVTALAGTYNVSVSQLAQGQTLASPFDGSDTSTLFSPTAPVGAGTLTIQLGRFNNTSFTAGNTPPLQVTINGTDTLVDVARKINEEGRAVSASVVNIDGGQRLILRSRETGLGQAFTVSVSGAAPGSALTRLAFDGSSSGGLERTVTAQNTLASVDGVSVESENNTLNDIIPGTTLTVSGVTTTPVQVRIQRDASVTRNALENFVEQYNQLNALLSDSLQFDAQTRVAGPFQGDITIVSAQSSLRQALGQVISTSSAFRSLSDIGIEFSRARDGSISINDEKGRFTNALADPENLRRFFTSAGLENAPSQGFGERLLAFTNTLVGTGGRFDQKQQSLESIISRLNTETERVNLRAESVQARLLQQYSRLDANLSQLTALNQFVNQQLQALNPSNNNNNRR